jgi:hypothetical protein
LERSLDSADATNATADDGLQAFLSRWKMNDFVFLLLEENLRPSNQDERGGDKPWFAVTPLAWRRLLVNPIVSAAEVDEAVAAFLLARAITAALFLLLSVRWAFAATRISDEEQLLRAAFLTLAWFWLLSPTMNPWYWTWALPLVPFARSRSWLAVSGLVMLYYLRFWFAAEWSVAPVVGTSYSGTEFFDYIVVWVEYVPWMTWLLMESLYRRRVASRD